MLPYNNFFDLRSLKQRPCPFFFNKYAFPRGRSEGMMEKDNVFYTLSIRFLPVYIFRVLGVSWTCSPRFLRKQTKIKRSCRIREQNVLSVVYIHYICICIILQYAFKGCNLAEVVEPCPCSRNALPCPPCPGHPARRPTRTPRMSARAWAQVPGPMGPHEARSVYPSIQIYMNSYKSIRA
jgi:hypothetical protein